MQLQRQMLKLAINFLTTIILIPDARSQSEMEYRLCIVDVLLPFCEQMLKDVQSHGRVVCVTGNDKIDCLHRIARNEADLMVLEAEGMYLAHQFFKNAFFVLTEIRTKARRLGSFEYDTVAIVRNSAQIRSLADLRGKKSCHTAYGKTIGWHVPTSKLYEQAITKINCSLTISAQEHDLAVISNFFGEACAPGAWVYDKEIDVKLKRKYPNMCTLCADPHECMESDRYAGFRGSLRCLTENNADVAWNRLETVYLFFGGQPIHSNEGKRETNTPVLSASEYSFLCPDGTSRPLTTTTPCIWAGKPWKAFVGAGRLATNALDMQNQINLYHRFGAVAEINPTSPFSAWLTNILEITFNEVEFRVPIEWAPTLTPLRYLDRGNYTMTIEKPRCKNIQATRFCVQSEIEKHKCLKAKMGAISRRITPYLDCVVGENAKDCIQKIAAGKADVISVDAKEAFEASRKYPLISILSESESSEGEETDDAERYAVAIVHKDSEIETIFDLQGKRSCHGSISSLTGWNIPITILRDSQLISTEHCNFGIALATFFRESCIPGASDPDLNLPDSLCAVCVGNNKELGLTRQNICANSELEDYYGDLGAFKCLCSSTADVAFIDHLTPILNTDGLANRTWAAGLKSSNFKLICPIGPSRLITEFRQCHWGKIPAHKVMTNALKENIQIEDIRLSLLKLSATFHHNQPVLRLFGPYDGIGNLMFKDKSLKLISLSEIKDDTLYGQDVYNQTIRDIQSCYINSSALINSLATILFISTLRNVLISLLLLVLF